MAQMNGMEKQNFTNSVRNGGKTAEMRNNSAKSGMVGMSVAISVAISGRLQSVSLWQLGANCQREKTY